MDFEKLGIFYLGRHVDPATRDVTATPLLYDASDLVTHAVIAGMTGSGKTGLGVALMEEAALDGIPVIAVDPKGDLANLLLTFPSLDAASFAPWVNQDDARAAGQTPEAFATAEAERWKAGLASWDEDGARLVRLRAAADFTLYTPGSTVARPISILRSFEAPPAAVAADPELMGDRVAAAATSLLTLAGLDVDPTTSREHVLVSTLLADAWHQGRGLDLPGLIAAIQAPPIATIGVLDVEAFYPAGDRFALAMRLNNLLAAPGFQAWLAGDPLDAGRLLYSDDGRPRVAVISLAHLDDRERMFFVTLLLDAVVTWMRGERGTSSLRGLLYFDEVVGYLPPVAAPPSKRPLLTLLKQARAYGVGLALATQNPVDLDYKALSNAGTWMLGRLQTERDKARVLDGLESASGAGLDRATLDRLLSSLGKREFLLHDVHEPAPAVFKTRWTMSYLRGPLGREELRRLAGTDARTSTPAGTGPAVPPPAAGATPHPAPDVARVEDHGRPLPPDGSGSQPLAPVLPPGIPVYVAPGAGAILAPVLFGAARVRYSDRRLGVDETADIAVVTPFADGPVPVDWDRAEPAPFAMSDLATGAPPGATYDAVPTDAANPKRYPQWQKSFASWAAATQAVELTTCAAVDLTSRPGEPDRDFRIRLQTAARERRDADIARIRARVGTKLTRLADKVRRAEQAVAREQQQATESKLQAGVSIAATVFGALLGRKAVSATTLGRATTAARGMSRAGRQAQDVTRAQESLAAAEAEREEMATSLENELRTIADRWDPAALPTDTVLVKPRRGGVEVQLVALVWVPR
ncbi:MAG: ATP-binding protein [Vicinamibacterales bacterium]